MSCCTKQSLVWSLCSCLMLSLSVQSTATAAATAKSVNAVRTCAYAPLARWETHLQLHPCPVLCGCSCACHVHVHVCVCLAGFGGASTQSSNIRAKRDSGRHALLCAHLLIAAGSAFTQAALGGYAQVGFETEGTAIYDVMRYCKNDVRSSKPFTR